MNVRMIKIHWKNFYFIFYFDLFEILEHNLKLRIKNWVTKSCENSKLEWAFNGIRREQWWLGLVWTFLSGLGVPYILSFLMCVCVREREKGKGKRESFRLGASTARVLKLRILFQKLLRTINLYMYQISY